MARWRLTQAHFLNVPGTEYTYTEAGNTGKQIKKRTPCPLYLDPRDPADYNYKDEGIIVSDGESEYSRDIVFTGQPTPDMEPLDAEARKISASYAAVWNRPPSDEEGRSYSEDLINLLSEKLNVNSNPAAPDQSAALTQMATMFEKMMEMNTALISKLEAPTRRV